MPNGTDVKLYAEDLPLSPGTFIVVASQRDATVEETTDPIDNSSKDARESKFIPGRYTTTITCDMLYVASAAHFTILQDAMRNGTMLKMQRDLDDGASGKEEIDCVVTSLSNQFPDQGESLISASFQGSGAWTAS